jgi:hypothetical protein
VVPDPGQPAATAADTEIAIGELPFDGLQARNEVLQALLLLPPLRLGGVATNPATLAACRNVKTLADPADASPQRPCLGSQVTLANCQQSSLIRVIAPAHRDELAAVISCLRRRRDSALALASRQPSWHRCARSALARRPR